MIQHILFISYPDPIKTGKGRSELSVLSSNTSGTLNLLQPLSSSTCLTSVVDSSLKSVAYVADVQM